MVLLVIGGGLIVLGVVLTMARKAQAKDLYTLEMVPRKTVKECKDSAAYVANEIGPGAFNENVKLVGNIQSDEPLVSELRQEPCVYSRMRVSRKYEERITERDPKTGRSSTRWVTREEELASNQKQIDFSLDDGTGAIDGTLDGCDFEPQEVLDQFVPQTSDRRLRFGSFSMDLGRWGNPGTRTLGFRYQEWVVPTQRRALIVGMATDRDGQLKIRKPREEQYDYLLSFKDEESLINQKEKNIKMLGFGIWGGFLLGGFLLLLGILQAAGVIPSAGTQ